MAGKFYVTTSIAYANAEPHIGYAMELIQADVLARYHREQGDNVYFLTGTDENGAKIARAAEEAGETPQQFTDRVSLTFQSLKADLHLSNDAFVRTSSHDHAKAAQALWKACSKDIYTATYEGWYCVGCEAYYTEAEAADQICPIHKKPLEQVKEDNYFFKLSAYNDAIREAIQSNKFLITPASKRNEILALLERGLEDISISRSTDKLTWGVPVPGDDKQVMYVWFDALSNYISALGYPDGELFQTMWPAEVQIVGKDIIRFHAAIWIGMLMSAGIPLPKQLYVHGFISSGGHKMSKSLGNVVSPDDIIQRYGIDALRYYLLSQIPSEGDGDFSWERLEVVYNTDLGNELGNLVQRVAAMITRYFDGTVGPIQPHSHDITLYTEAMAALRFDRALEEVWVLVKGLNQYLDEEKPWSLAKDEANREHLREVLDHAVSDIQQLAILLLPFMPSASGRMIATFADGVVHPEVGILFPRIEPQPEVKFDVSDTPAA